jgi:hypothetical protein
VQNNYCTSKSLCFGKKKCQSCCSCEKRPGPIKSRRWTTDRTGFMAGLAQRTYLHSLGNKRSPFQFPHHSEPPCKGFAGAAKPPPAVPPGAGSGGDRRRHEALAALPGCREERSRYASPPQIPAPSSPPSLLARAPAGFPANSARDLSSARG